MKVIEVKDYSEMSQKAAEFIIAKVQSNQNMVLGLATGGTPEGTYKHLIRDHQENKTSYAGIKSYNLDEYVGLSGEDEQSYRFYMDSHFFNHVDIEKANTHVPNGLAPDANVECKEYEERIANNGPIDLQLLGIGGNGHIGFNEPGTSFSQETHVVDLAQETIEANARYFEDINQVPKKAFTMGIATIMKSNEILLLASGSAKKEAMKKLLSGGDVSEDFPASILRNHPNVTIIADEEALSEAKQYQ